jgi:hypothetical protein
MEILKGVLAFMISKLMTALFLSIMIIGAASAVTICPFDPIDPSEAMHTSFEGLITNGGIVSGFMFGTTEHVSGINETELTGYISSGKDLIGKGTDIKYANEFGVTGDTVTSTTGVSLDRGRVNFGESTLLSYATQSNVMNDNSTYIPFCEHMYSGMDVMLTSGTFGSTINTLGGGSTNLLQHDAAVSGIGSFSGVASYGLMQGNVTASNTMFTRDTIHLIGNMEFGRTVSFKSVKA